MTIADSGGEWTATVQPPNAPGGGLSVAADGPDIPVVRATGRPKVSDEGPDPLTLQHTALAKELGIPPDAPTVTAQAGHTFAINVGGLPAGTLSVTGRSGMRGRFAYSFNDLGRNPDEHGTR